MAYPFDSGVYGSLLNQYPSRPIRGTDIFEKQGDELILIGHTKSWCDDLENTLNEAIAKAEQYYNRLVELGDITPKESTEDLLIKALGAIEALTKKVESLEGGNIGESDRQSDGNAGRNKPTSSAGGAKSKE